MTVEVNGLNGMSGTKGTTGLNGVPRDASVGDDAHEHRRLETEIAAAKARTAAAKERAAAIESEVQADMRRELVASRETVEEMERNHAVAVAMIRDAAQAEADRILEEARQHAATTREVRDVG